MPTYKEMYFILVRAQRDAILILQKAHQKTEDIYSSADVPDHLRVVHLESRQKAAQPDIHCLNLSARVYNALDNWFGKRGRDYVLTINDVLSIKSYKQLRQIRRLGPKACSELISKMQEAGFTHWAEQMASS